MKSLAEIIEYDGFKDLDLNRIFTADEFEDFVTSNTNCELVHGNILEGTYLGVWRGVVRSNLYDAWLLFDREKKLGKFSQFVHFRLSDDTVPLSDLQFWKKGHYPKIRDKAAEITPELVVEFLPSEEVRGDNDIAVLQEKIKLYQAANIPLVWLVKLDDQQVEVYHPGDQGPRTLSKDDYLDGENVIPDFKLSVAELFSEDY